MQEPFEQVREKLFPERKNFLSYSYILFKFCEILGLDEFKQNFQLLKGRDKLHKQDQIFRAICEKLNWLELITSCNVIFFFIVIFGSPNLIHLLFTSFANFLFAPGVQDLDRRRRRDFDLRSEPPRNLRRRLDLGAALPILRQDPLLNSIVPGTLS